MVQFPPAKRSCWMLICKAELVVNVHLPKDRISMAHQGYGFIPIPQLDSMSDGPSEVTSSAIHEDRCTFLLTWLLLRRDHDTVTVIWSDMAIASSQRDIRKGISEDEKCYAREIEAQRVQSWSLDDLGLKHLDHYFCQIIAIQNLLQVSNRPCLIMAPMSQKVIVAIIPADLTMWTLLLSFRLKTHSNLKYSLSLLYHGEICKLNAILMLVSYNIDGFVAPISE
ncbi:hypothetical protein BJ138DRAFT_1098940 [Hygrophoropsis aurantiaca]|uniref:Uncharacterized protein n=1 Tax=Hygrophoropsis aurantiaca TaxID=72124 RepID=A0ACB8AMA1_9AGAM|nr:hypothetical protein BJ138DRAFT_1098940 [Hygrophoropsis aurantiaca]